MFLDVNSLSYAKDMKKYFFSTFLGFSFGLWISWPGLVSPSKWNCALELVFDSTKYQTPLKAAFATPPQYFFKNTSYRGPFGKIRILGDACFR